MKMKDKGGRKEETTFKDDGRKIGPITLPLRNSDPLTTQTLPTRSNPTATAETTPSLGREYLRPTALDRSSSQELENTNSLEFLSLIQTISFYPTLPLFRQHPTRSILNSQPNGRTLATIDPNR